MCYAQRHTDWMVIGKADVKIYNDINGSVIQKYS